jgi:predicted ABC-type transport system involved in lysophospholipase L1 biosynthesis ATPase subunit
MVFICGLYDLGYEGRSWTFEKKVAGGEYCRVQLDRALATSD